MHGYLHAEEMDVLVTLEEAEEFPALYVILRTVNGDLTSLFLGFIFSMYLHESACMC